MEDTGCKVFSEMKRLLYKWKKREMQPTIWKPKEYTHNEVLIIII